MKPSLPRFKISKRSRVCTVRQPSHQDRITASVFLRRYVVTNKMLNRWAGLIALMKREKRRGTITERDEFSSVPLCEPRSPELHGNKFGRRKWRDRERPSIRSEIRKRGSDFRSNGSPGIDIPCSWFCYRPIGRRKETGPLCSTFLIETSLYFMYTR